VVGRYCGADCSGGAASPSRSFRGGAGRRQGSSFVAGGLESSNIVATVGGIVEGEHRELLVSPSISLGGSLIFVRGTMTNFTAILSAVVVMISRRLSRMW
jgi:hypothetical protein